MGIFDGTGLDPEFTPTTDIWLSTLAELERRGIEIHGSLSQGKVDARATAVVLKATKTNSGRVGWTKPPRMKNWLRNGNQKPRWEKPIGTPTSNGLMHNWKVSSESLCRCGRVETS